MAYKSRYGLPGKEIDNLQKRYAKQGLSEGFESFDNFLKFCVSKNFKHGCVMRRYDASKPHSPENTYFVLRKQAVQKPRIKKDDTPPAPESPCKKCKLECTIHASGCAEWREWFVKNWDKNIHRKVELPKNPEKRNREAFRYEHPDLVREGIVWRA